MRLEIKSTLIIIGTLVIGMLLGAASLSVVMRHRVERLHGMMRHGGLPQHMLEAIGPLPDAQRAAVQQVLDQTSLQVDSTIQGNRREVHAMIDSMVTRLDSLLTDEQRLRLHHEVGARFSGREGPPFDGPPHRHHRRWW